MAALPLAGCSAPFYRPASTPAPAAKEIGLTAWDEERLVVLTMTPGDQQMMRLIGGMAYGMAAGPNPTSTGMVSSGTLFSPTDSDPSAAFTAAMLAEKPWLATTIRAQLTSAAESRGIKVVPLPMPADAAEQIEWHQSLNYSAAPTALILEVMPAWVGYLRSGDAWVPSAEVSVTYMTRNHEIFYIRWFAFGAASSSVRGARAIGIRADEKYSFPTVQDLIAHPSLAAEGIRSAAAPISQAVIQAVMPGK